jgi:hypothetical protein
MMPTCPRCHGTGGFVRKDGKKPKIKGQLCITYGKAARMVICEFCNGSGISVSESDFNEPVTSLLDMETRKRLVFGRW